MKQPIDSDLAQRALRTFLEALGYDTSRPELVGTPARVVEAYQHDLLAGENVDIQRLLEQGSIPSESRSLVIVRGISTMTMCPHHLLPAQGQATVAYLPGSRILGLGTMAQLVDACCRRLTLQEQIGDAVTDALTRWLDARGAFCMLRFEHSCLRLRGTRQSCANVETVHVEGQLKEAPHAQHLAIALGRAGAELEAAP